MLACLSRAVFVVVMIGAPAPGAIVEPKTRGLQVSRNDWGSVPLLGALDMIFSAAQHSNAAIAEMVRSLSSEWAWGHPRTRPVSWSLYPLILSRVPAPCYLLAFGSPILSHQAHSQEAGTLPSLG